MRTRCSGRNMSRKKSRAFVSRGAEPKNICWPVGPPHHPTAFWYGSVEGQCDIVLSKLDGGHWLFIFEGVRGSHYFGSHWVSQSRLIAIGHTGHDHWKQLKKGDPHISCSFAGHWLSDLMLQRCTGTSLTRDWHRHSLIPMGASSQRLCLSRFPFFRRVFDRNHDTRHIFRFVRKV